MRQRRVQIVATIGPSSRDPAILEEMIRTGMGVARLNFAHGDPAQHRETVELIRGAAAAVGRPVAVLQDLPGPKIRLGEIEGGPVTLSPDRELQIRCDTAKGDGEHLPTADPYLAREVCPGDRILLGDGAVELEVFEIDGLVIRCRVIVGGVVSSGKGINAAGRLSSRPILSAVDRAALELGVELGVDLVGVSYVRTEGDLTAIRKVLRSLGRAIPLVAKIETRLALEHLDEILIRTDAVMIARGDLSLEIPYERVPIEQKRIVRAAVRAGRPVITATQMLQSMVTASRPTRAEATDVANAVLDGTDAVMLSDETAIGVDPVRVCRAMVRIIEEVEADGVSEFRLPEGSHLSGELRELSVFAQAAVRTVRDVGARGIITWSRGGLAARLLSRQRPNVPILAPTRIEETYRRLTLPYGVRPILAPSGRMKRSQLEAELGPIEDQALLLIVRHEAGDQRRIPWMGLVRAVDTEAWAVEKDSG